MSKKPSLAFRLFRKVTIFDFISFFGNEKIHFDMKESMKESREKISARS
jgi:hypothetical protein